MTAGPAATNADWWGLAGKRVVLVGAGGIGLACLRAFHEVGAQVAAIDARPEPLERAAEVIVGLATVTGDVSVPETARASLAEAVAALGGLDVFVHAAGMNVRQPILLTRVEDWHAMLAANLSSAFYLGQAAGGLLTEQGSGRMIFLSSVAGRMAHRDHGPYAATKAGLDQLIRVMANEWADTGVCVNAVAPGYTETRLTANHLARPGVRPALEALVPAGRLGTVDDVTGPVIFLASERARFVTGQVLYVDGGRTLV